MEDGYLVMWKKTQINLYKPGFLLGFFLSTEGELNEWGPLPNGTDLLPVMVTRYWLKRKTDVYTC